MIRSYAFLYDTGVIDIWLAYCEIELLHIISIRTIVFIATIKSKKSFEIKMTKT